MLMDRSDMTDPEAECFPDGTPIDGWFGDWEKPGLSRLGKQYVLTDYGIFDDGKVYTNEIQKVIDLAAAQGGGAVVVPAGTYFTGSVYFKQGVNLYVSQGGTLKGSSHIWDYDLAETRIEGETCLYFTALINGDGLDGFTICGPGTIDGNGLGSWKDFWLRTQWNKGCTNKDGQRPRLVYLSNCSNVTICDVTLQNSHYWTTHLYRCHHVKYLDCRIFSPASPVKAPSTDAIDLDVCADILVKGCYMEVNDDSVVLKGGKGPWADTLPENGPNERIIIEDCMYGFCHGCLTCGSESIHNRNILMRRIRVRGAARLLWLKMRPDTPQRYEYITVEQVEGQVGEFINITPWTQFYDLKDRKDRPLSYGDHITVRDCACGCDIFFHVAPDESQYILSDFTLERLDIQAKDRGAAFDGVRNLTAREVNVCLR